MVSVCLPPHHVVSYHADDCAQRAKRALYAKRSHSGAIARGRLLVIITIMNRKRTKIRKEETSVSFTMSAINNKYKELAIIHNNDNSNCKSSVR